MDRSSTDESWHQFLCDSMAISKLMLRYGSKRELVEWGVDPNVADVIIQMRIERRA